MLCVSGDQQKAVILGGLPADVPTDLDHPYVFEFNGAHLFISDEGEVAFVHKGPTNNDGSVKEDYKEKGGTTVRFDKEGSIILTDSKGQYLKINAKDETLEGQVNKQLIS